MILAVSDLALSQRKISFFLFICEYFYGHVAASGRINVHLVFPCVLVAQWSHHEHKTIFLLCSSFFGRLWRFILVNGFYVEHCLMEPIFHHLLCLFIYFRQRTSYQSEHFAAIDEDNSRLLQGDVNMTTAHNRLPKFQIFFWVILVGKSSKYGGCI